MLLATPCGHCVHMLYNDAIVRDFFSKRWKHMHEMEESRQPLYLYTQPSRCHHFISATWMIYYEYIWVLNRQHIQMGNLSLVRPFSRWCGIFLSDCFFSQQIGSSLVFVFVSSQGVLRRPRWRRSHKKQPGPAVFSVLAKCKMWFQEILQGVESDEFQVFVSS